MENQTETATLRVFELVFGDGASTGPSVSAYFCCFLLDDALGWGGNSAGTNAEDSTASVAGSVWDAEPATAAVLALHSRGLTKVDACT